MVTEGSVELRVQGGVVAKALEEKASSNVSEKSQILMRLNPQRQCKL
jgi:hypothetical protein